MKNFSNEDDKNIVSTKNTHSQEQWTEEETNFFHIVWHLWFDFDTSQTFQCSFKNACAKRKIHLKRNKNKNKNLQRKYVMFLENFKESVILSKVIVVANKQLTNINRAIINNKLASNIFAAGFAGFSFFVIRFCHVYLPFIGRRKKGQTCAFSVHRMEIISGFNSKSGFMLVDIVVSWTFSFFSFRSLARKQSKSIFFFCPRFIVFILSVRQNKEMYIAFQLAIF